jgi:hypothetical protein
VIAQSVQRWTTGWTIGILGFDSWRGLGIFLFTTASRTALRPTQPLIQWALGALSAGVKRPGCEVDHSPPSSVEVKEWVELYLHSPIRPHGLVLSWSTGKILPLAYDVVWMKIGFTSKRQVTEFGVFQEDIPRYLHQADYKFKYVKKKFISVILLWIRTY